MSLRICFWLSVAVCLSISAWAQTPAASYDLIIYTPGNPTPQTRNVLATAVQCNQPTGAGNTTNPTTW